MRKGKLSQPDRRQTNRWGIDLAYEDALGTWHDTEQKTVTAVLAAMGAVDESPVEQPDPVILVRRGESRNFGKPGHITLETGDVIRFLHTLPGNLPTGYHQLQLSDDEHVAMLIVSPQQCWLPHDLRTWGWAVQLYSARSKESWGIGDFGDLERLATWSAHDLNAGMMLLNPLSSATPILPQQTSPYFPTSRIFLNPLWLRMEWLPGFADNPHFQMLAARAQALNQQRLIDRDVVFQLKMSVLDSLWEQFSETPEFIQFCRFGGEALRRYAIFCALAERHQSGWHKWPADFQHPERPQVALFEQQNQERVRFHQWVQWLLDGQLARCSRHLSLMQDLPIGVDPDGADAWAWQDTLAGGIGVGAPPDEFNTQGQGWGLPPFIPHKLREAAYQPFIQTIRAALRHGGGLRIDHVMGLFRLFWIPDGMSPAQGAYVRYNADEMLAIVALESERARAYVVGEDLGTVEDDAREKLAAWGVLSYRLLWFEKNSPADYPLEALAAVTTHDLPTICGVWNESDIQRLRDLGLSPNEASTREIRERLGDMTGLSDKARLSEVVEQAYCRLAEAPCRILTAALDDAALAQERPNIPATTGEKNPNWCLALPEPLEDLIASDLPQRIAKALSREQRNGR